MVVEYLITIKTLNYKKLRRNQQKFEIFFAKFQALFLRRLLMYNYIYHVKLLFVQYFDSGDHQMIYTIIISLIIEKLFSLLRSQSFPFQIVSEFTDTFVKFSNVMGLLTPCFVPRGGFLYTMIVLGYNLPSSRVPGVCPGGGWFWMKLIPASVRLRLLVIGFCSSSCRNEVS